MGQEPLRSLNKQHCDQSQTPAEEEEGEYRARGSGRPLGAPARDRVVADVRPDRVVVLLVRVSRGHRGAHVRAGGRAGAGTGEEVFAEARHRRGRRRYPARGAARRHRARDGRRRRQQNRSGGARRGLVREGARSGGGARRRGLARRARGDHPQGLAGAPRRRGLRRGRVGAAAIPPKSRAARSVRRRAPSLEVKVAPRILGRQYG